MMLATAVLNQQAPAGGAFNPETDITWHSLFWAEGTGFTALGLADTDPVSTWPNETAETDMTGANTPTYVAADAGFNGQPAVSFTAANILGGAFGSAVTQPYSVVCVGRYDTIATNTALLGYQGGTFALLLHQASGNLNAFVGSSVVFGTADTDEHLFRVLFNNGGTGAIEVDGTVTTGTFSGTSSLAGLQLTAANGSRLAPGALCLVGIYEGDITADGNWSAFKSWVSTHYGITIV